MYKFLVVVIVSFATLFTGAAAKPGILAAPLGYANAPLYAAGGSSQLDVRNNYDGTLSSYATAPFGYAAPYSSRYISGIPAAPAFEAAAVPAPAPLAAAPYTDLSYANSPFAAALAAPYVI